MSEQVSPAAAEDAVEFAYRQVRQAILVGDLAPGAKISQVKLAQEFGISRTPLREALSRLAAEGLVTSTFNRRVSVSELDLDDFEQIYAIRMSVEPVGIRKTAPRLTLTDRHAIGLSLSDMDAAMEQRDMAAFRAAHRAFHLGLTMHSGTRICRLLEDMWDYSERYRLSYMHYRIDAEDAVVLDRLHEAQREHRAIFTALENDEIDECAALQVAHLTRTLDGVMRDAVEQSLISHT